MNRDPRELERERQNKAFREGDEVRTSKDQLRGFFNGMLFVTALELSFLVERTGRPPIKDLIFYLVMGLIGNFVVFVLGYSGWVINLKSKYDKIITILGMNAFAAYVLYRIFWR